MYGADPGRDAPPREDLALLRMTSWRGILGSGYDPSDERLLTAETAGLRMSEVE